MRQTQRQTDRQRQAGRQTDRQTDTGRQADRQTDTGRQTDRLRQAGRQADRQTDTGRPTDRQTGRQTDTGTETESEYKSNKTTIEHSPTFSCYGYSKRFTRKVNEYIILIAVSIAVPFWSPETATESLVNCLFLNCFKNCEQ